MKCIQFADGILFIIHGKWGVCRSLPDIELHLKGMVLSSGEMITSYLLSGAKHAGFLRKIKGARGVNSSVKFCNSKERPPTHPPTTIQTGMAALRVSVSVVLHLFHVPAQSAHFKRTYAGAEIDGRRMRFRLRGEIWRAMGPSS